MMLMPQLITRTGRTGNSLITVPENYWKNFAFLFLINIQSCTMMYIPVKLLRNLPTNADISDKATEEPHLKAQCLT